MNLFLVPASQENIRKTIIGSVPIAIASNFLTSNQISNLKESLNGNDSFNCWAMTEGRKSTYSAMHLGDIVFLTPKNTGIFKYIGKVICKFENENFGNNLWQFTPGKPWKLIYVLEEIKEINIRKPRLVQELGFKTNYNVPGAIMVKQVNLNKVLDRYGNINSFIKSLEEKDNKSLE